MGFKSVEPLNPTITVTLRLFLRFCSQAASATEPFASTSARKHPDCPQDLTISNAPQAIDAAGFFLARFSPCAEYAGSGPTAELGIIGREEVPCVTPLL